MNIKRKILWRLLHTLKKQVVSFLFTLLLSGVVVMGSLWLPLQTGKVMDVIFLKDMQMSSDVFGILYRMSLMIVGIVLCRYIIQRIHNRMVFRMIQNLRQEAMDKVQKLPLAYLDRHAQGDIISRIVNDAEQMADGLLLGFSQFFSGILTIIGIVVVMFTVHIGISLYVVLVTPLSIFVASYIAKKTYHYFQKQNQERGELVSYMNERISGHSTIKIFQQEDTTVREFENKNMQLAQSNQKAVFLSSLTNPSTRFVNGIVYAGVALIGALAALQGGSFTIGMLTCLLSYATQYAKPFNEITAVIAEMQNALSCAQRIFELIDEEPEINLGQEDEDWTCESGDVCFDQISFGYEEGKLLFSNISLSVKAGDKIAIVGPTGCGKTTLIQLLMRFYELREGAILLDGKNITEIPRKSLRGSYGMVLQDTWLKEASIRDNLCYASRMITQQEMEEAAKQTGIHSLIIALENGYDTLLSEEGGFLSAGQKQLLCITRAMLSKPSLLILDEATSSIDTRTEKLIQEAFLLLMSGKTSFIVAHRLSTIQGADQIVVMEAGKIVAMGNHQALMKEEGLYKQMYESQIS